MLLKKYPVTKRIGAGYPIDKRTGKHYSWGFDFRTGGERYQERGFVTKQQAEERIVAIKKAAIDLRSGILPPEPPAAKPFLIDLFQKKLDSMTERREKVRAKRVFDKFLELNGREILVEDIRSHHFQNYNDTRAKAGVSAATIKRELVPLTAALHSAYSYFAQLDSYRPPRIPRPKVSKARKSRTISHDEREKLFKWFFAPQRPTERWPKQYEARRRVGLFMQFSLLTVSRPGEVAKLRKSDVDWHTMTVKIVGTKTRFVSENSVRELPITPTMAEILRERFEKAPGEFLFTKDGKTNWKWNELLKEACEACSIEYGRANAEGITFHTTRHTGVTELARSNRVDTKTTGAFTGHSDEAMTLYYTHTNSGLLKIAGEVLEETMGGTFVEPPEQKSEMIN